MLLGTASQSLTSRVAEDGFPAPRLLRDGVLRTPPQGEACFGGIHKCLILRAYEGLPIGWISAVRPSRQPLRGFLRMRSFLNSINVSPHDEDDEERPTGSVSKHAPRPSSRYAGASSILSQAAMKKRGHARGPAPAPTAFAPFSWIVVRGAPRWLSLRCLACVDTRLTLRACECFGIIPGFCGMHEAGHKLWPGHLGGMR